MYQVFIGAMPLPIAPARIDTKYPNRNISVSLINDGEISIPKLPGLAEISFDFLVPSANNYPFATAAGQILNAVTGSLGVLGNLANGAIGTAILAYLEHLKVNKKPVQLIIIKLGEGVSMVNGGAFNMKVTLEDYSIAEDAVEYGFDFSIAVNFKEYKPYTTKILGNDGKITAKRG